MVHHVNRAAVKTTATPEQVEAALKSWRDQGRSSARHRRRQRDDGPGLDAKLQELRRRRNVLDPEIAGVLAAVPDDRGAGVDV